MLERCITKWVTLGQAWPKGGLLRARRTKDWNRKTEVWKRIFLFKRKLGGGNANIFHFHTYLGKFPILTHIFGMG